LIYIEAVKFNMFFINCTDSFQNETHYMTAAAPVRTKFDDDRLV